MPEPQDVGRVTGRIPRSFLYISITMCGFQFGIAGVLLITKIIMKKKNCNWSWLTVLILSAFSAFWVSCSKDDEVTPEIQVPAGNENYFEKNMDFDSPAAEKSFTFSSNVSWSISASETRNGSSWLTVSPTSGEAGTHTIKVKVAENTTYDDRNTVITLTAGEISRKIIVNQKQLDALTVTTNRFEVPVAGGSISIEVKANVDYEVIIPDEYKDWIHNNTSTTRGLTSSSLSFTIDKSEEYDKREGKIIIKSSKKEEVITIYQTGDGILTLSQNEYNLNSSSQEIAIDINSNFDYVVELPNVDWIKEITDQTRGISTHTLKLEISENESYDNRSARIKIYDRNSSLSEEIVINQSQKNALLIDKKNFEFDENGGSFTVNINSNVAYSIENNCDWITETSAPHRSLSESSHTFTVSAISDNADREGKITFSDQNTGVSEIVVVKQNRAIFFESTTLIMMEDAEQTISITNKTDQNINWSSSKTSVATVNNTGLVKALSKGSATITATTADGKHTCKCEVIVKNITDFISATNVGGSISSINGLIRYGSILYWKFSNNSSEKVTLKSMQLIDGVTGNEGNQMSVGVDVDANSSVSYSTTIGLAGIHAPVTCRFRYTYKNKEYSVDAVYSSNW